MTINRKIEGKKILDNLVTIAILVVFLFPIYWMVITSFKSPSEIFANPPTFYPHKVYLDGYISQLVIRTSVPIWKNLLNSFIISIETTVISTILAVFSAYGLARFPFKINKWLLYGILITQMLPNVMFLSPLFSVFSKIGILDSLISTVIFVCIRSIPFSIITLRPYYLDIPKELEDAAVIDGCNHFVTFFKIILPISFPGIIVVSAFTFLWGWGELMGPLTFIKSDSLYPLTVNMYKAIGEYGIEWNSLMAFAVILTIPVLLIFIFLQKYLIGGITAGAVKG